MSLGAALLIFAQSAAPLAAEVPAPRSNPIAVQARASARIIRPASVDFKNFDEASNKAPAPSARETQRRRDANGTLWVEFS